MPKTETPPFVKQLIYLHLVHRELYKQMAFWSLFPNKCCDLFIGNNINSSISLLASLDSFKNTVVGLFISSKQNELLLYQKK